jgi:transposase-like protein
MPKVANKKSPLESRIPLACADEAAAVVFLEEQRGWTTEADAACPKCGVLGESKQMRSKTGERNARYLWRCGACKQQFTVRVGTIMEDSPIPLRHWCLAFYRAAASKKGISALQIQRETGLTYKSALFLMHRIRWAMTPANEQEPKLGSGGGVVEFDETWVGGKPRRFHRRGADPEKRAWDFSRRKTPVVAGIERGGQVKVSVVYGINRTSLETHVNNMVHEDAHLMTDELNSYKSIGRRYAKHTTVRHNVDEYVRYEPDGFVATTNSIESFWARLKRQLHGTHHAVSRKHLHRYLSEVEFKHNNRSLSDGERTVKLIRAASQRRLTYKQQVKNLGKLFRYSDR